MHQLYLLAMLCTNVVNGPVLPKDPSASHALYYVDAIADATPTNARGLQIISVRLKLKPMHPDGQTGPRALTMKVTAATGNARTKVDVIYPRGYQPEQFITYDRDELAIQIIVQRAESDLSPVQGQVDFGVLSVF